MSDGINQIAFVLPGLPTSRNKLYYSDPRSGGAEWSRAALQWKAEVRPHIPPFQLTFDWSIVRIQLMLYYPWYSKKGEWLVRDDDNVIKIVIDTIAKKCGFNDCRVKRGSWGSVNSSEVKTHVVLSEILYDSTGRSIQETNSNQGSAKEGLDSILAM